MKKLPFLLLFLSLNSLVFAQDISSDRLVNWSVAGLIKDIQEPSTIINVADHGLLGDSLTNNSDFIQTAINALGGNAGVLFFPQGRYTFKSTFNVPQGVIIRGEGSDKTKFYFDLGGASSHCFSISKSQSGDFVEVYSGFEKSSDTLVLKSALNMNAGDFAEMRQENGDWDTNPASWAEYSVGQILRIESQNQDSLFLENALRLDFDTALNLEVRKIEPIKDVAFECFYVERLDEPTSAGSNFFFNYAANCRISGVESNVSSGAHIYINQSSNILVEGSYIHHAHKYNGSGTNGYGVMLARYSGECLIQNNIFRKLRHAMMVKQGANGNVFSYNYSIEPNRSEFLSSYTGDISLHGHFAFSNLFEGNVVQNIILDHYWGSSGPFNTFLRNRVELYGLIFSNDGSVLTDKQNVIANEIIANSYPYGQYDLNGSDHYEYGNNDAGTTKPSGTSDVSVESYYLDSQPDFWSNGTPWPSIGYPNTLDQYKNPAQLRYESGSDFTVCPEPQTDIEEEYLSDQIKVSPNPFNSHLYLYLNVDFQEFLFVEMYNIQGKLVFRKEYSPGNNEIFLSNEISNLPTGFYTIVLVDNVKRYSQKIIKK